MRSTLRWIVSGLLGLSFTWAAGGATGTARASCPETKLHVSASSDADAYVIPALELGESHAGENVDGHAVVGSCTTEGLEVELDGRLVAIYSEDTVRVPGDDGEEIVIRHLGDDRSRVLVRGRDDEDLTIDLREDRVVLLGESGRDKVVVRHAEDGQIVVSSSDEGNLVINLRKDGLVLLGDGDDKTLILRLDRDDEGHSTIKIE